MTAWAFVGCFKLLVVFSPKHRGIIENAKNGKVNAAAVIGFTSALFFVFVFIFIFHDKVVWSIEEIAMFFLFYILIGLMGCISIIRIHDYEMEKKDDNINNY